MHRTTGTAFSLGESTYVAPAINSSTVLAFVKLNNVVIKRIVEIIMTIIRAVAPSTARQTTTGTNRRKIIRESISVPVALIVEESENI